METVWLALIAQGQGFKATAKGERTSASGKSHRLPDSRGAGVENVGAEAVLGERPLLSEWHAICGVCGVVHTHNHFILASSQALCNVEIKLHPTHFSRQIPESAPLIFSTSYVSSD